MSDWIAAHPDWIEIRSPSSAGVVEANRHRGEQESIQLALELRAPLLIDEHKPRQWAIAKGIAVVGTIGILERAAKIGLVSDLSYVYDRIRESDFRIDPRILTASLDRHEARKKV